MTSHHAWPPADLYRTGASWRALLAALSSSSALRLRATARMMEDWDRAERPEGPGVGKGGRSPGRVRLRGALHEALRCQTCRGCQN